MSSGGLGAPFLGDCGDSPYFEAGRTRIAGYPRQSATSSGDCDIVIAPYRTVERHLTAHNLLDRFDQIVASGDYMAGKPAPDPFLTAAERLGIEPRLCLALEDSYNRVRSAFAAGMMTIMVPDLLEPTVEIRDLCVHVAQDLHEVRRLILR
jgi:beta-phosphoglucomutase-like phosphatase (HAD superfamily)